MGIQHYFCTNECVMTDGSGSVWEVTNQDGERVASCSSEDAAGELEMNLNMTLTDWCEADESDRVANCV